MLYLLDANVLIDANNLYYPIDKVPEFWNWLIFQGKKGNVKMPIENMEEVKEGRKEKDLLVEWIHDSENEMALLLEEEVNPLFVQKVVTVGYAPDLTDDEVENLGRDPFLIAYALSNPERCIVTTEVSKPRKIRQNRHIPDVCITLSLPWCNTFEMNRRLNFSTRWNFS